MSNSHVRRHEGTMRSAAAIISRRSHGFVLRWYSECPAAKELRSVAAWRFEPSERSAPEPKSAASAYIVKVASRPTAATDREQPKSQFVEPAAGSVPVPSVACRTRGGRGRQQCREQEVAILQCSTAVTPNPSLQPTRTVIGLGPRSAVVYRALHGPSPTPPRAAELER